MSNIRFVWDPNKARQNLIKHKVSFEDARSVFYDDYVQLTADPEHSKDEGRFILLGRGSQARILVVCHCYRESDSVISKRRIGF